MLQYRSSDRTVVAATHGRGLWSAIFPIILPVTLINFQGHLSNNEIILDWSTRSEQNSKYFDVQKSTDGIHFYSIGSVAAAGNSASRSNYNLADKQVTEFNYYRLKMVDIDGQFFYSQTILLKDPDAQQNLWVLNNPFETVIKFRLAKTPQHKVLVDLTNMAGVRVYHNEYQGSNEITIDLSGINLATGTYILRTNIDGQLYTRKLIKK